MILGVNWHRDPVGKYRDFFTSEETRAGLGKNLRHVVGPYGYLRYPGGNFVQVFPVDPVEAQSDFIYPGFPVFYKFCSEYGLKVVQQLPTYGYVNGGVRKTIKTSVKGPVDWGLVDMIIDQAVAMVRWIKDNGYSDLVVFWQIGNEEWIDIEGRMTPEQYVGVVERYLKALDSVVPPGKILVTAQPGLRGGSRNWGHDVLRLIKGKGLAGLIGGATTHIYPYFLNRAEFDAPGFDFEAYATGNRLPAVFSSEVLKLTKILDELDYGEGVQVHVTEMSIGVAGPVRESDKWNSFGKNRKDYAAAFGAARSVLEMAGSRRFGGAAYFSLFQKYLVAPEGSNPTPWKDYTAASDWGWGESWYVTDRKPGRFVNSPLLEAWALIEAFLYDSAPVNRISTEAFMAAEPGSKETRVFILNVSDKEITVNLSGSDRGMLLSGGLKSRAIVLGSHGEKDATPVLPKAVSLDGKVKLPPYAMLLSRGADLMYNGVKVVSGFIKTKAYENGRPLPMGSFSVRCSGRRLFPQPDGATVENYPLVLIAGLEGMTEEEVSRKVFGVTHDELESWSVGPDDGA